MKKIKVLHIINTIEPGGSGNLLHAQRPYVDNDRFQIYLAYLTKTKTYFEGFPHIEIVDLSECTDIQVSYDTSTKLTKDWGKWEHKAHKGSIMYAPTDLAYGLMRTLQTLTDMEPGSKAVSHLVTRNKDEIPELIRKIRA